jgi:hypothetical protein
MSAGATLTRDGYCVLPGILDPAMLRRVQAQCRRVVDGIGTTHRGLQRAPGSLVHVAVDPFFAELIAWPRTLAALAGLGLGGARFSSGYVISKPPRSPPLFWHQDWWGWDHPLSYTERILQVFVFYYLTDTEVENGCLRVVPGSHRKRHRIHDVLPNAHAEDLSRAADPEHPAFQPVADEVAVPVRAGDIVIGDARLLHGAYANRSENERTCVTLWFHPRFTEQPEEIQSRVATIAERKDVDTDPGENAPPFSEIWPPAALDTIAPHLASYHGPVAPIAWNRSATLDRLK